MRQGKTMKRFPLLAGMVLLASAAADDQATARVGSYAPNAYGLYDPPDGE